MGNNYSWNSDNNGNKKAPKGFFGKLFALLKGKSIHDSTEQKFSYNFTYTQNDKSKDNSNSLYSFVPKEKSKKRTVPAKKALAAAPEEKAKDKYIDSTAPASDTIVTEDSKFIPETNAVSADDNSSNAVTEDKKNVVTEERPMTPEELKQRFRENKLRKFKEGLSAIPCVEIKKGEPVPRRGEKLDEIKIRNIIRSTRPETLFPLVVVDVETTGLSPLRNKIVEVSAIKYELGFKPVACFSTLVNPDSKIPPAVTQINNITDDMVKDKPLFSEIAASFNEFIKGCNILGHNVGFDLNFLYASGIDFSPKAKFFDTLQLAKNTLISENSSKLYYDPEAEVDVTDYKLETLLDYYYIYREDAHRSLSDCYATALLFLNLVADKADIYL